MGIGRRAEHAGGGRGRDEGEDATMGIKQWTSGGVAEVVIDFPPVNALPVQGWFDLADAITAAGADPQVRAVILAAEGRGFCAGVDIKEMQRTPGHEALVGANRGCFAAFAAVYDCAVPVIAAVHGFCLGGGVGLAGSADLVVAAQDATFGLPEVNRGALGAATHLARLVPHQLMRTMVYTCRAVTAQQLLSFGTVLDVVPPPDLRAAARAVAAEIAAKDGGIIRLAKQSLNGIDPVDVKRSYRYEQGFTFELNLTGVVGGGPAGVRGWPAVSAAVMRPDAIIGELRSGMTIGIGGWGSRRKPMALVRAILRSDLADLTVVSYGGPDVGLLIAGGHVRRVVTGFVSLDTIPLEPHFRLARQRGSIELTELDEGLLHQGLVAAAHRLPFLPVRAGLGSDVLRVNPDLRTVVSPYGGEELVAMPALRLDAALIHLNRADAAGNGQYLGPDPYFDDLFCLAAERAYLSCERLVPTAGLLESGPPQSLLVNRAMVAGVAETPGGAHFTSCVPDYGRDEAFQARYAAAAADPDGWRQFRAGYLDGDEASYQEAVRRFTESSADTTQPAAAP